MKSHSSSIMRLTLITLALTLVLGCQFLSPAAQPSPTPEAPPAATTETPPTATVETPPTVELTPEAPTPTPPDFPTVQPRAKSVFAPYNPQPVDVTPALEQPAIAPDLSNVYNPFAFGDQLKRLGEDGLVVSPGDVKEFYTLYERARYDNQPIFVTSDSLLHVYHLLFDKVAAHCRVAILHPPPARPECRHAGQSRRAVPGLRGTPWEDAALRTVAFHRR